MRRGFTIVELLIVIVVIGILAGISIVAYSGVQSRAQIASVQSDLTQAIQKLESLKITDSSETYPTQLLATDFDASQGNTITYTAYTTSEGVNKGYCIQSSNNGATYYATNQGSLKQGSCQTIINYTRDPSAETSTSNFSSVGSGIASNSTSIASDKYHEGATSLKKVATSNGTLAAVAYSDNLTLSTGDVVRWSLWVYSTRSGTLAPYIEGSRISDSAYWGQGNGAQSVPANTWTKITGTVTANNNVNVSKYGAYNLAGQTGDTLWYDEFLITKDITFLPEYADGDAPSWRWLGTANNSRSTGPAL